MRSMLTKVGRPAQRLLQLNPEQFEIHYRGQPLQRIRRRSKTNSAVAGYRNNPVAPPGRTEAKAAQWGGYLSLSGNEAKSGTVPFPAARLFRRCGVPDGPVGSG